MKSFIRGILTVWVVILLILFVFVNSTKAILMDTTDGIIKKELKTNIVEVIVYHSEEKIPEDVIKDVEKEIDNNLNIKELMDNYYDNILDVLSSKESSVNIDSAKELEALINDGEEVLKDHGITLTQDEKDELLSVVSSDEVNDLVNDAISEIKSDMSIDIKKMIDAYIFLTSITFKVILAALIAAALVFIALLKKNFYGWLLNFGTASVITGILMGVIFPIVITQIITYLASDSSIIISTKTLNTYGYTLIILGLVSIVIERMIAAKNKKKAES